MPSNRGPKAPDDGIKLAKKDSNERKSILDKMKKHTKVDVKKADGKKAICGSWVNLQHGRILCNFLSLERQLQPLLEYAQRVQGDDDVEMAIPSSDMVFLLLGIRN